MTSCKPPPTCIDASPIPDANDSRMSAIPYEANLTPMGGIPLLVARQLGREDLAGAGVNGQMKLAPGPLAPRTVLLHPPLAGAVDLQTRGVDHDVNRPARLGSRQRCSERQARAAPRKRGVVGHTDAYPEQRRE